MQTLILALIFPVIAAVFTIVFAALWWIDRSNKPVLAFAFCFGAVSTALALDTVLWDSHSAATILLFHALSASGTTAMLWGIGKRAKVRAPITAAVLSAIMAAIVMWLGVRLRAPQVDFDVQLIHSSLLFTFIAMTLWRAAKKDVFDRVVMWLFIVMAATGFSQSAVYRLVTAQWPGDNAVLDIVISISIVVDVVILSLIALCLAGSVIDERMRRNQVEARIDRLSGLPNRTAFEVEAVAALARGEAANIPVSVIIADIDHFKRINDTWGHAVGDQAISGFARLLAGKIRGCDLAGRIGGEEFCLVVWNCNESSAAGLANRIRTALAGRKPRDAESDLPAYTASFGVAEARRGEGYASLAKRADAALYAAKNSGRNRVCIADADSDPETLAAEISQAERRPMDREGAKVVPLVRRQTG